MRTDDLDYALPPELVAQEPVEPRDAARLLVVDRATGALQHRHVRDLPELVRPDDLVVVNTTRVRHARLRGRRATGGAVEVLLLAPRADGAWDALARPARRLRPGEAIAVGDRLAVRIVERTAERRRWWCGWSRTTRWRTPSSAPAPSRCRPTSGPSWAIRSATRRSTPSARAPPPRRRPGLHLTPELLATLRARTAGVESVDLEIGLDTFRPVAVDDVDDHPMHAEAYRVDPAVRARIAAAAPGPRAGGRHDDRARARDRRRPRGARRRAAPRLKIQPGHALPPASAPC